MGRAAYFRSFLTFSSSAGRLSAKVSLRDYIRKDRPISQADQSIIYQKHEPARTYLGLAGRVGAQTVEGSGLRNRLSSQRGTKSRSSKSQ